MASVSRGIAETLDRLDRVLRERAPKLWHSRRPPASAADLEALQRAVHPYEHPAEVTALLRWADGHAPGAPWWPSIDCGPLLSTAQTAEAYTWLSNETERWQWNPLWLPIAHEGWYQAGVEMTTDQPGVVIDGSFPDPEVRVVSPSLVAMLDLAADMLEAGLSLQEPHDPDDKRSWRDQRQGLIDRRDEWQRGHMTA